MRANISDPSLPEPAGTGWNLFAAWKTDQHAQAPQFIGQSWADYMDDLEDRQLSQRRKLQRRIGIAAAFTLLVVVLLVLRIVS